MHLLKAQRQAAEENFDTTIFLEGAAGTGKTTAAIERVKSLIRAGISPDSILILVPQAPLALPYIDAIRRARTVKGVSVQTATLSSLAVQMVDLFWPLIAEEVGFEKHQERPHFLSLELAQYYMARYIEPEIRKRDYFNSVHINPNRLYTQIIDNLNKAALVGFDYERIGTKLKSAWAGDSEQAAIYDDAQACATRFREVCRELNLIDFSLHITLFVDYLWTKEQPRRYLTSQYRHLIVDNLEEDTPAMHDLLTQWLDACDSALLLMDSEGGFRRFLGADPVNALNLKRRCDVKITLDKTRVMSKELEAFHNEMAHSLGRPTNSKIQADARAAITYADLQYLPQTVDWTVDQITALIRDEGVPPHEIVILSAFLPDALRFSLQTRLDERGIPNRSHRPSRALRDEPATRTLVTFAKLAHPAWGRLPTRFEVAFALTAAIRDLDAVRARLLTEALYRDGQLLPFSQITDSALQERITFELGAKYDHLRKWLERYQQTEMLALDIFFSRLFGEVLSQPRFGFHQNLDVATTSANLIDSARQFRQTLSRIEPDIASAPDYIVMLDNGVLGNQYLPDKSSKDAVLIAPAYTFLTNNVAVDYQFWLNVGSSGWGQRLYQPLTQPYVLSRHWPEGRVWTDADEHQANQEAVYQLVAGLIRRCRQRIYLGFSQYGEQGFEQRGALLMAVQGMLRRLAKADAHV